MTDLKSFMLPNDKLNNEEVITFKGVETFKDASGNPIPLKFKKLSKKELRKIRSNHTTKKYLTNENGDYVLNAGNAVLCEDINMEGYNDEVIVESMVYPNLKDPALMEHYNIYSATELLNYLFRGENYDYIDRCAAQASGRVALDQKMVYDDDTIKELKN